MVPRSLARQLNRLRRRERLLRLTWAVARCLAIFGSVLAAACLLDFVIDLYRDTPRWLRAGLLGVQAGLWLGGGVFLVRQAVGKLSDTRLSLWIEEKMPALGHRLISAVQLNRPGADTRGMSPEMIAAVTRQAEEQAAAVDYARVADGRRWKWSAQLLAPLVLVALLIFALWPDTVRALLARQFLEERAIPRSLAIESIHAHQAWPAGEEGVLRFRVRGAFAEQQRGEVRIEMEDGSSERHELVFEDLDEEGAATFRARVPPSSSDFTYRAWLKDGRTHESAEVHFEPRPVVRRQQAWVQLPASVGRKANGQAYEEPQKGADILYRLPGSRGRVLIETQKPIVKATVEMLGPPHGLSATARPGSRAESVRRSVDLTVGADGCTAEGTFAFEPSFRPDSLALLAAGIGAGGPVTLPWAALVLSASGEPLQAETAYRIVVRDAFGLENSDRPRRGIRTGPIDPPDVALLPEMLPRPGGTEPSDEDEIEGIPILLGQRVPLAYECKAVYGLSHAQLRYRVIPHGLSREEEDEPRDSDFLPLPLGRRQGKHEEAEFFTRPSEDPDKLDGTEGGGRYDFDSAGIPDGKGGLRRLQEGDRIQFYVEVFGRADPDGTPGRSALREKEVVNQKDFWAWVEKKEDHKERIRQLEEKQRGMSGTVSLLPEDRPRFAPAPPQPPPREQPVALSEDDSILGRSWLLLGPFPNDKDAGRARAYPPETEPFTLGKEYDGLKGKARWQLHHSTTDKIDLQKFFDHGEAGVAYAVCWVKSTGTQRVLLSTGSDDGIKVWIDRKLVLDKAVHREAIRGDDRTPITLREGWQEVLVKVDNRFGTWAFYFDLLDAGSGKPLSPERLRVRTTPLTAQDKTFVKNWLILGPFAADKGAGHGKVFPPERDAVDLKREYEGRKGKKIRWKEYHSREDRIDLLPACGVSLYDSRGVVAYAVCWVKSDKERMATLATGSDDGIKVWINRKIVHDKATARVAQPDCDRIAVRLKPGWNEVLVKVDNIEGTWAFYLELRDSDSGKTLPGVQYRLAPP